MKKLLPVFMLLICSGLIAQEQLHRVDISPLLVFQLRHYFINSPNVDAIGHQQTCEA